MNGPAWALRPGRRRPSGPAVEWAAAGLAWLLPAAAAARGVRRAARSRCVRNATSFASPPCHPLRPLGWGSASGVGGGDAVWGAGTRGPGWAEVCRHAGLGREKVRAGWAISILEFSRGKSKTFQGWKPHRFVAPIRQLSNRSDLWYVHIVGTFLSYERSLFRSYGGPGAPV